MVFTKRERIVFVLAGAALAVVLLVSYVLVPLWDARNEAKARKAKLADEVSTANLLLQTSLQMEAKWREMVINGMKNQREEADFQVLSAVDGWSKAEVMKLSAMIRQDRSASDSALPERYFHAAGEGNMKAVAGFIWRLETAKFPLRIQSLQIGSAKPGVDSLTVQIDFSTLYAPGGGQMPPAGGVKTASAGGQDK